MKQYSHIGPHIAAVFLAGLLSGCALFPQTGEDTVRLSPAAFDDLPGWQTDAVSEAIPAFKKSCDRLLKKDDAAEFGTGGFAGKASDWKLACEKLIVSAPQTNDDARRYFEENFIPYAVSGNKGRDGLFTGYYEPQLRGSPVKQAPYLVPLYARPLDLITVNLGDFKPALKGETVMGRVVGDKLVPYHTRAAIEKGALGDIPPIVWVDNAVDAFFLHIQGSGQVTMTDGTTLHVGYAAQNGQAYYAIGQELIKRGAVTKENVSMQTIRAWLESHPSDAPAVMDLNASYVFFRALDGEGPLGAEGVALTPRRSLAVDRKKIPYGVPLFLDAEAPEGEQRLQRLMVAQDTGGAITGAVRGDFFWGAGDEAAHKAGLMKSTGRFYALLPKTVALP